MKCLWLDTESFSKYRDCMETCKPIRGITESTFSQVTVWSGWKAQQSQTATFRRTLWEVTLSLETIIFLPLVLNSSSAPLCTKCRHWWGSIYINISLHTPGQGPVGKKASTQVSPHRSPTGTSHVIYNVHVIYHFQEGPTQGGRLFVSNWVR